MPSTVLRGRVWGGAIGEKEVLPQTSFKFLKILEGSPAGKQQTAQGSSW